MGLGGSTGKVDSLELFYHGACKAFWGRGFPIIALCNEANVPYTIKGNDEVPEDALCFAVPIVSFNGEGIYMSQMPAILEHLGDAVGLGGTTHAKKVAVKQLILDFVDASAETMSKKLIDNADRAKKWLG